MFDIVDENYKFDNGNIYKIVYGYKNCRSRFTSK